MRIFRKLYVRFRRSHKKRKLRKYKERILSEYARDNHKLFKFLKKHTSNYPFFNIISKKNYMHIKHVSREYRRYLSDKSLYPELSEDVLDGCLRFYGAKLICSQDQFKMFYELERLNIIYRCEFTDFQLYKYYHRDCYHIRYFMSELFIDFIDRL